MKMNAIKITAVSKKNFLAYFVISRYSLSQSERMAISIYRTPNNRIMTNQNE